MARAYQLKVVAKGDSSDAQRAMKDLSGGAKRMSGAVKKAFKVVAVAGAAALAVGIGMAAREGMAELKEMTKVNAQTEAAVARMGKANLVSAKNVQSLAGTLQEKSGIDDQAIQSMQNMVLTLGELDTSTKRGANMFKQASFAATGMAEALDMDVVGAGKQVAKTMAAAASGTLLLPRGMKLAAGAQKKLKDAFGKGSTAASRQAAVLQVLGKKFKGSIKLTDAEKLDVLKDKFAGLSASLMLKLMPAFQKVIVGATKVLAAIEKWASSRQGQQTIERISAAAKKFGSIIADATRWVIKHKDALMAVAVGVTVFVAALRTMMFIQTVIKLVKMWRAGQIALNITLMANPIGLVIAAIAGLVAGLVFAYKKSDTFKRIVRNAFKKVQEAASAVWKWIKKNWPLLLAILTGPIGIAVLVITRNWGKIRAGAASAVGWIKEKFASLVDWFRALPDRFNSFVTGLGNLGQRAGKALADALKAAINSVLDRIRSFRLPTITVAGKTIPGSGARPFSGIPRLSGGGVLEKEGMFWGAEGNRKEAVVPLHKSRRRDAARVMRQAGLDRMMGGGDTYNFTINGPTAEDPVALAHRVAWLTRNRNLAGRMA